jgi:hypothetical protein
MDVDTQGIINIEKLKRGNWPDKTNPVLEKLGKTKFAWHLEKESLVIWDEVHQANSYKSQNCHALAYAKPYQLKMLMLSATAAQSPLNMRAMGYHMDFHKFRDFYS